MARYSKKIRRLTKAKKRNKAQAQHQEWLEEKRRLKNLGQKADYFQFQVYGKLDDKTIREYKQYIKHLNKGLTPESIYDWKNIKPAYIDKAKTWVGEDR